MIIGAGLNDTELVHAGLQACVEDKTPPLSVQVGVAASLQLMRKADPEIDCLLNVIYDGPPVRS